MKDYKSKDIVGKKCQIELEEPIEEIRRLSTAILIGTIVQTPKNSDNGDWFLVSLDVASTSVIGSKYALCNRRYVGQRLVDEIEEKNGVVVNIGIGKEAESLVEQKLSDTAIAEFAKRNPMKFYISTVKLI